jgi:hypothetical protein
LVATRQTVRWILILPAGMAAWYLALAVGIALYQALETLCHADQIESGHHCYAPWFSRITRALIVFGAGLAAVFVMMACTWTAPSHKRQVALITFVAGTVAAIIMGAYLQAYLAMVTAIIAGAVTLAVLLRKVAHA